MASKRRFEYPPRVLDDVGDAVVVVIGDDSSDSLNGHFNSKNQEDDRHSQWNESKARASLVR